MLAIWAGFAALTKPIGAILQAYLFTNSPWKVFIAFTDFHNYYAHNLI